MSLLLNATEVIKAAILLEQRASKFYATAAEKMEGDNQKLLLQLSGMEKAHEAKFKKLLEEIQASSSAETTTISEEEKYFLEAITSDRIISTECSFFSGDSLESILEKAMILEKNSVFFYSSVKESLMLKMEVEAVNKLIVEEIRHFRLLNQALANLSEKTS